MAHTIEHPFSGSGITTCSYGGQAAAKVAKTVTPKYKGKPMSQMDLSTTWLKDFATHADGPVVRYSKTLGNGTQQIVLVSKKGDNILVEYITDGKSSGIVDGVPDAKKTLQSWTKSYKENGWDVEWKYPVEAADGLGVTEAAFEAANTTGSWEVALAKAAKKELNVGDVVARGVDKQGNRWRVVYQGDMKWKAETWLSPEDGWIGTLKTTANMHDEFMGPGAKWGDEFKWQWGKAKGEPPAVPHGSTSIGAMTDEDASALFVQIKDDFATARGINIKGVNKALDDAVFKKIAELTGYTPSEIAAKVERYKANGNKLSALKKKQLKSGQKIDATKYAKQETVDKAVADLKAPNVADNLGVYSDEDVAKAYIKAKDHVASLESNNWTLYSADPAFEDAVRAYMKTEYGVDVNAVRLKQHLADYISSDGKLSVLKKKMVKSGEMEKKADTLKGGDKFDFLKKTQTKGDDQISVGGKTLKKNPGSPTAEELADLGYTPTGAKVHTFTDPEVVDMYSQVKSGTYLTSSPESVYDKMLKYQQKMHDQGKDVSILDIVRAFDKEAARRFGVADQHLYEKKLADWASSPTGKKYIKDKYESEALLRNQPPLPADSTKFNVISTQKASQIQQDMGTWHPEGKSALRRYTSVYDDMNDSLRGKQPMTSHVRDLNREAWKAMKPSTEDMLLHRGTGVDAFGFEKYSHHDAKDFAKFVGETYEEKGFSSTSVGGHAAFGSKPVLLEIEAPRGTQMAYLKPISSFSGENEMLLAPNTHYKILKVSERNGQVVLRVRVVHSEAYKGQL